MSRATETIGRPGPGRVALIVLLVGALIVASAGAAFAFFTASTNINVSAAASSLSAPTSPIATANSSTQITVGWTLPGSQLAGAQYQVKRTAGPGSPSTVCTVNSSTTSCADTGLTPSTSYTYSIVAFINAWQTTAITASTSTNSGDTTPPTIASVTTPANGTVFRASTVPATFSGSAADNSGGVGLAANSTTFTLQRPSDNFYWTGSAWQATAFNLATTHPATTSNTAAAWTSSAAMPTWASQAEGAFTVRATSTDTAGNAFAGTAITFTLDKTNPTAALVTSPANGAVFRAATVPSSFTGSANDNTNGSGLNANTTTFTLQRPDGNYWTGTTWQAAVFNLATTHPATTGNTASAWTSNVTLPSWAGAATPDGVYTIQATATDKAGNAFTGTAITFTLDKTNPITASVTTPTAGSTFKGTTVPSSFSGSAADNLNGAGLNANSTTFTLQRSSDNNFWTGSAWQIAGSNLATTHAATTSNTATSWTNAATLPAWASTTDGVYTVTATATDKAGNTLTGAAVTFILDNTAPTLNSINRAGGSATVNSGPLSWTVTFSEPVNGVTTSNFALATSGTGGTTPSITSATATGGAPSATWNVSVSTTGTTGTNAGSIGLNLANATNIKDVATNNLSTSTFTGQAYTYDTTAPSLSTLQMLDVNHNGKVDQVVATFNEALAACTAPCTTGWTLTSAPSGATLNTVTISGAQATLNLTEGAGAADTSVGSFTVTLANTSGITDAVGNHASFAATAPSDGAAPVPTSMTSANGGTTAGKAEAGDTITVTFSEPLAALSATTSTVVLSADNGNNGPVRVSISGLTSGTFQIGTTTDYLAKNSADATFNNSTLSKPSSNQVRVTLGTYNNQGSLTVGATSAATGTLTPAATITDAALNGAAGTLAVPNSTLRFF